MTVSPSNCDPCEALPYNPSSNAFSHSFLFSTWSSTLLLETQSIISKITWLSNHNLLLITTFIPVLVSNIPLSKTKILLDALYPNSNNYLPHWSLYWFLFSIISFIIFFFILTLFRVDGSSKYFFLHLSLQNTKFARFQFWLTSSSHPTSCSRLLSSFTWVAESC